MATKAAVEDGAAHSTSLQRARGRLGERSCHLRSESSESIRDPKNVEPSLTWRKRARFFKFRGKNLLTLLLKTLDTRWLCPCLQKVFFPLFSFVISLLPLESNGIHSKFRNIRSYYSNQVS